MKVAFAVSCNNLYVNCLFALLKSIVKNDPDFNYDFWVIDSGLSDINKEKMRGIYSNIMFKSYDETIYHEHRKENLKYRSIEMFSITGYDKVIQLGADCILLNPVTDLVNEECDIGMPREKLRNNMFSSGIMIIGKKYLNKETYMGLLKASYDKVVMFGTDMKLYNCYFNDNITEIDYHYNVMVSEHTLPEWDLGKTIFLHYCHKPQATRDKLPMYLYELWDGYFNG